MSHYNSSSATGSWQSQRNTQTNQSQETGSNLSGLFNSSAAANLLAQFSSLGNVNLNNLAANLPAIVAATNTNSSTQNPTQNNQAASNNSGYQWHSQNRLATQTNSNSSNQSYLLGPGGTMSNNFASSKNQSNQKSSQNYDSRNESKQNKSSTYSKVSNYSNSSRDRQQTQANRYQNQSTSKFDSSTNNNNHQQQTNQMQSVLPNLTQNPLIAQALLTQLAQTAQQNQTNLVSALAAAVTNNNLNQSLSKRSRSRSKSKVHSRSRSRSRESSQRARNGRMNRNDSNRDIRRVQHSSRSKSPSNITKRLSYPGSSKGRDTRDIKENSRDPVKESKTEIKESFSKDLIKDNKIRYNIKLPKLPIDTMYNNVSSLKQRYPLLYIPSDYIDSKSSWLNSFSLSKPLRLNNKCQFHVMNKNALPLTRNTSVYDANDADYKWQVKVMLLSMPSPDELFKRCCSLAEDNSKEHRQESPSKVIQFLLGNKGKHELMALGGPWSPSLDGLDPATNTQTLINTAIRTVKALTGIDLSPCNQWFRFLDIQYNRSEEFKSKIDASSEEEMLIFDDEKYVENTVIFVPNVWSIMPTNLEYQKQVDAYQNLIENEPDWVSEPVKDEPAAPCNGDDQHKLNKVENDGQAEAGTDSEANLTSNSIDVDQVNEPTHYSKLDLKKMKVDELRCELAARNLDVKGLKQQLINRLKDALETEKAQDGIDVSIDPKEASFLDDAVDLSQQSLVMDEEAVKIESKDEKKPSQPYTWSKLSRAEREKAYRLPVTPHIIVHPSPTFKQNKFECQLVSLSHILDYRREDNKECSFEVFLFAEFFHEMLLRDNAFQVYKHFLGLRDDSDKTSGKRKMSDEENSTEAKKSKTDDENKKTDEHHHQKQQEKSLRTKTLYPELLFSFTYIDSNRSNYLNEKDLEDLFYLIGLNLSRSKCKALLKKLNIKDGLLNYRTLTDRSLGSSGTSSFYKIPTDDEIANNIIFFDSYLTRSGSKCPNTNEIDHKTTAVAAAPTATTIVEINGSTIDVLTTVRKLEKCEDSLKEIDLKYKEALDELDRVKVLNRTLDRHKQKLVDEASELKKKLRDEQRFSKDSDDKYLRLKDCLYRTKTQLNKVLDDISDSTRRGQKSLDSKSVKTDSDKKESDGKDTKKTDDDLKNPTLNENTQENGYQDGAGDEVKIEQRLPMDEETKDDETKLNSNENELSQPVDNLMLEINSNEKTNEIDLIN